MEISPEQNEKIKDSLPLQRGNVRLTNLDLECDPVCDRAGMQVARTSQALWQLAYDLRADESLGEERRAGPGV